MMNKTVTAILVDDEAGARSSLSELLTQCCPEVEIMSEAAHVDEAVKQIQQHCPDLVFLDIEMPQKSGFELINAFQTLHFHIIFVTAYDQYAVKAFEVSAVDYLLKPVDEDRLKTAVDRVLQKQKEKSDLSHFKVLKENIRGNMLKKLTILYKGSRIIVNIEDIITIEADSSWSIVLVSDSDKKTEKRYTYSRNLHHFEKLFGDLPQLHRTHNSWIVNTCYITSYSKTERRITLKNGTTVPVGRTYKKAFENLMGF